MYLTNALVLLAGFGSFVAAAPASVGHAAGIVDRHIVARDAKGGKSPAKLHNEGNTIIIQQTVVQSEVTILEENLGLVNQLALVAEQEFSALVQSQLALVEEVETIKNNIRVNHFLARFSQVNTVIVSVTELVDLRDSKSRNTRYMVNQLLADNGQPESSVVVMLTAANPVTIGVATPTLNLAGLLGANATALPSAVVASVVSAASASASAAAASGTSSTPQVAAFDPNNPFGQINQTIILPYGSKAPSLPNGAQVVADPANIILPNQNTLLVEDITQFNADCSLYNSNGLSLFNLQSAVLQAEEIAALELSGLTLGSASSLNSAAAALQGGAGSITNVGSTALTTATIAIAATSSAAAASVVTTAASSSVAVAASTAAAAVVAGAAVIASSAPAAPAASGGGVGVQIVAVPAS